MPDTLSPREEEMLDRLQRKIDEIFVPELDGEAKVRILKAAMDGLASRPPK